MPERSAEGEKQTTRLWLIVCVLLSLVLIVAARIKGGYVDEYWTLGFADSTLPLKQAFQAWSIDTPHPVGFYALSRMADVLLDRDIVVRRFTNVLFFGFAVFCAWRTDKQCRAFALAYVATVAASPYLVERFAEYRASFAALMFTTVLVLRVRAITGPAGASTKDALVLALLMGALGLTDYPLAVAGLALCGALALLSLFERDGRAFLIAAAGIGACLLVVALSLANAARFPMAPSPYFQSWTGLVRDLAVVVITAVVPCMVVLAAALRRWIRNPTSLGRVWTGDRFVQVLAMSLALLLVAILLINGVTHSLIRRQLFGFIPLSVGLIMAISWPHVRQRPAIIGLVAVNLVTVAAATAYHLKSKPNFDRFAEQMARAQLSCSTLPIYAVLPDRITGHATNPYPTRHQVALGFQDVARRHRFNVRRDLPRNWVDPKCGAIIWSEYLWMDGRPSAELIAHKLQLKPELVTGATIGYVDQSLMIRVPPPR